MTVYIGPNGERRVDVGRLPRSEAKQLRRLARGKRGSGRGKAASAPLRAAQPAEDITPASGPDQAGAGE